MLRTIFFTLLILSTSLFASTTKQEVERVFPDNYTPTPFENLDPAYDPRFVYWPKGFNETENMLAGTIYIYGWEQEPPNGLVLYIYDDRSTLVNRTWIDIQVQSGVKDDLNNVVIDQTIYMSRVEIVPQGWTRVMVNIHNYKGMLTRAKLLKVYNVNSIHPID
ncbi:hypothetical protein [Pseudoalteromonas tunicata]|uniref:hypothetical protein n=1 Tax=Pseudoalteromonas tunicata TaxID=314281 RepID=UPI00273D51E0|nr:hypothetical protein [Pseudoalteromonas tunicata]MDP4985718.1 hypothetical protein [Pseudoalteromonas tunicata]